ncbi:hypothetical protein [Segatella sp.]|uniref:hypothetical protein n=1 Tax=Segatella sp. TaxID=2974253 RepID=UPI00307A45C3
MDRRRKPAIREPRPEITLEEMRAILENITEIESATGIRYVKLHVTAKMIIGIRESHRVRNLPSISTTSTALIRNASDSPVRR